MIYLFDNLKLLGLQCQMECQKNPRCTNFQYQKYNNTCELKNSTSGSSLPDTSFLNGPAVCDFMKSNSCFIFWENS